MNLPGRGAFLALILGLFLGTGPSANPAQAQSLNFAGGDSDDPIEIFADNGIEWQQENQIFLARGNARAVRGEVNVNAEVLRAYYRETKETGTDIWRLDAEGKVKITSPGETVYGDQGVYDIDNSILVIKGNKVRFVTDDDEITANSQLEYWEKKLMAVARGNATAVRQEKRLRADVLAAYFRRNKSGKNIIFRIEAFDNVVIVTGKDKVTSDRAVYNVESGIATLTGSVTIIRGSTRLDGCRAEVNLNTSISKLFSCGPREGGGKRVMGTLTSEGLRRDVKEN